MAEPNGKSGQHINNPLTVTENARSPASVKIKNRQNRLSPPGAKSLSAFLAHTAASAIISADPASNENRISIHMNKPAAEIKVPNPNPAATDSFSTRILSRAIFEYDAYNRIKK